jgi:hypothetical protein
MRSEFLVYARLGFEHIVDINGLDHILFLAALFAGFVWSEWKYVLLLITSFTVGHTTTLAIATLNIVSLDTNIVELLIPITIFATCLINVFGRNNSGLQGEKDVYVRRLIYALTLLFGLIHGLGFSTFLRAILGAEESIIIPLLAFNIGLELGQIVLVGLFLFVTSAVLKTEIFDRRIWIIVISTCIGIASAVMVATRLIGN